MKYVLQATQIQLWILIEMCVCIEDDGKKLNNEKINKRKKNIKWKKIIIIISEATDL